MNNIALLTIVTIMCIRALELTTSLCTLTNMSPFPPSPPAPRNRCSTLLYYELGFFGFHIYDHTAFFFD